MATRHPEQHRKLRRGERGQAMVEYSMINYLLIFIVGVGMLGRFADGKNLMEMFLEAYQTYYDSFYFVLNLPFP